MTPTTWASLAVSGVGLIAGLLASAVSLANRALLAEVRKDQAEMELRIVDRLNGKVVPRGECVLRHQAVEKALDEISEDLRARPRRA